MFLTTECRLLSRLKIAFVITALFMSNSSMAVCYKEDLQGYWDIYFAVDEEAYTCSLRVSNGKISMHRFGCEASDGAEASSIKGTATIDKYCHVGLDININTNTGPARIRAIKSTLNRNRDHIEGIGTIDGLFGGDGFSMIKFY
jgi:hypothetical protein